MKDGFITHIKSHSELQETITRRKDKFFQLGLTLQPLVIIVGDSTIVVHSITGFVESFSSNYPCRMCKIKKEDMRKQCYVDINLHRSWEQYNLYN
ncbi:unnamed protein product [Macrosiphum euphorbiae]|uniref:Uncharacterized protein n=1 Tax=Macrosiphum euphorbiae TaxID=13131 RepID=A0AAV0XEE6_9HEMI|nr:unnamed protein product [Macrosiphum euphorbiae]